MRGMQAAKIIGNLHGLTEDAAKDFIKTQMTADEFIQDLVKGIEEGTDGVNGKTAAMMGMVEKIKGTWVGAQDSFKSALKNAGLSLMGTYKDEEGITHYKFLESMTTSLNNISSAIKNIASVLQPLMDIIETVMLKVSEAVKNIAQYYADLDEDTKRHIGNVVAILTLLGPALIVFSSFGKMLIKTVGFIKTFTTSMGTMSLLITTILFGIGTNFDGARQRVEEFFGCIVQGIMAAFKVLSEGTDAVKKRVDFLKSVLIEHPKSFISKVQLFALKAIGLIRAIASAWEDGFVDNELWDLMEALGIRPIVEAILNLKYNIENFVEGFKIGFQNVISEAESFVGKLVSIFENSPLAPIFQMIQDMLHSWIEAGQGDYFKDLGERFANMLPMILAIVTGVKAFGGLGGVFNLLSRSVGGLVRGLTQLGGNALSSVFSMFTNLGNGAGGLLSGFRDRMNRNATNYITGVFRDVFGDIDISDREGALNNFLLSNIASGETKEALLEKGGNIYDTLIEGINTASKGKGTTIDLFKGIFANIKDFGGMVKNVVMHPIQSMFSLFKTMGSGVVSIFKMIGSALMSPVVAITAIVALIGIMYATNENFRESVNTLIGSVINAIKVILSALSPVFDVIKQIFAVVMQVIQAVAGVLAPIIKFIAGIITALTPVLKVIISVIMVPIKIIASILKIVADVLSAIIKFVGGIRDAIVEKIAPLVEWLSPIVKSVGEFLDKLGNWISGKGWKTDKELGMSNEVTKPVNIDTEIGLKELYNLGGQTENSLLTEEEQIEAKENSGSLFSLSDLIPNSTTNNEVNEGQQVQNIETTNTVTFNKESIVIQIAQATVEEAEDLANRVIAIIKNRMQTNSMASYNADLQTASRNMGYIM